MKSKRNSQSVFSTQENTKSEITVDGKQQKDSKEAPWSDEQQGEPSATCIVVSEPHETGFRNKLKSLWKWKSDSDYKEKVVTHPPPAGKINVKWTSGPISKGKIEVQDQSHANFDDLLRSLGLEEYYPQKLKERESSVVRKASKIPLKKTQKDSFCCVTKINDGQH